MLPSLTEGLPYHTLPKILGYTSFPMKNAGLLTVFLAAGVCAIATSEPSRSDTSFALLRHPTLSQSTVVFEYAGDLWSASRNGGEATHLTTNVGIEDNPAFSPDGSQIAFTGEYDGNVDVFVMPAAGGVPKRLTWHPAPDRVLGWTPDGKRILFASPRTAYSRFYELFTVSRDGGFPEKLPLPMGVGGAYSPDGRNLAYMPLMPAFEGVEALSGRQSQRHLAGRS
jgi:tricorn protease